MSLLTTAVRDEPLLDVTIKFVDLTFAVFEGVSNPYASEMQLTFSQRTGPTMTRHHYMLDSIVSITRSTITTEGGNDQART
jgi:hypothetical protein